MRMKLSVVLALTAVPMVACSGGGSGGGDVRDSTPEFWKGANQSQFDPATDGPWMEENKVNAQIETFRLPLTSDADIANAIERVKKLTLNSEFLGIVPVIDWSMIPDSAAALDLAFMERYFTAYDQLLEALPARAIIFLETVLLAELEAKVTGPYVSARTAYVTDAGGVPYIAPMKEMFESLCKRAAKKGKSFCTVMSLQPQNAFYTDASFQPVVYADEASQFLKDSGALFASRFGINARNGGPGVSLDRVFVLSSVLRSNLNRVGILWSLRILRDDFEAAFPIMIDSIAEYAEAGLFGVFYQTYSPPTLQPFTGGAEVIDPAPTPDPVFPVNVLDLELVEFAP